MSIEKQVAVVTGAAQGIGRAIALALAKRNVRVICLDCREEENERTARDAAAISTAGSAACHILEWDAGQPTGQALLLMYPEDCEKLKNGTVKELVQ